MKRAALYARVSTDNQKDEQTIETQLHEIREAIKADGCLLIEDCVYKDEGWSGAFLERPALDQLRQDAKLNKFDIVYVFDRGRLSRKFVYQEIVIEELGHSGVGFKSLHDVNGTTPEEQLMGSVMGVFHEYERVKIAERFRLGKLNKVRGGNLLGYNPPYGYSYIPVKGKGVNKQNGYFEINEQEAKVVRMMFEWVGIEGISLREVIRRLYELEIPPKKGKRASWTKGPVSRLLTNETYVGRHYYYKLEAVLPQNPQAKSTQKYKHRHTNKTSRKVRDKEEWLMVKVPVIVDEALFDKVQKQIKLNAKFAQRNKRHKYLFGGLVWCPCGAKRVGDGPDGKKYYRCTDRLHNFPLPTVCKEAGVNVTVLDAAGWEKICDLLTNPDLIKQQVQRYADKKIDMAQDTASSNDVKQNLKLLEEEERRYAKMYGQTLMSEEVYQEQIKSVRKRREELLKLQSEPVEDKLSQFQNMDLDHLAKGFNEFMAKLPFEGKLFTVRKIVDKVIATKEEVTISGFIPTMESIASGKERFRAEDSDYWNSNIPNEGGKVGLRAINRNSRTAKCRQIDTF